jgi:hypothetical protein
MRPASRVSRHTFVGIDVVANGHAVLAAAASTAGVAHWAAAFPADKANATLRDHGTEEGRRPFGVELHNSVDWQLVIVLSVRVDSPIIGSPGPKLSMPTSMAICAPGA